MGQNEDKFRSLKDEEIVRLNELFEDFSNEETDFGNAVKRGYYIEKEVEKKSLLFISMNPSYTDPDKKKEKPQNNGTEAGENAVYSIIDFGKEIGIEEENAGEEKKDGYTLERKKVEDTNSFFKQIHKFYNELKKGLEKELKENSSILPPLAHHDLLFIRETSQDNIEKWMENKIRMEKSRQDGKIEWGKWEESDNKANDFFNTQLELSKNIIEQSEPRLIVVLNAGARKLFQEEELFKDKYKGTFDEEITATYMYEINGKDVPVIFTGMLSGQHALDSGSKNILKDYIKLVLKKINTKESEV